MRSESAAKAVVYCLGCGAVEERQMTKDATEFEAFEVLLAWNRERAVVWSARCRKCGLSASVREELR
ncbi:MAG: hypothetical protein ACO1OB_17005 [Archangium sp.]